MAIISSRGWFLRLLLLLWAAGFLLSHAPAQELAKRLILKDGSYQLATKWETKGDRVRYLSAERNEWEEVPDSMVDWPATEKYEKDRAAGISAPEAVALDKEVAQERKLEEAMSPQVAPGLRLPLDGDIFLLDNFESQPQLVALQQNTGEVDRNAKHNILRAAINPVSGSKQMIELPGLHAKIQAHAVLPSIYVNTEQDQGSAVMSEQPTRSEKPMEDAWDRFRIVRLDSKQNKRIIGDIKVAVYGKVSQEQKLVPTTAQKLTGGWVKITPKNDMAPGEYAVVEMLGKEGMNTFVWDFGVNPSAPANVATIKPEAIPTPDKSKGLEHR
ncbi:MAG TPA: hypothetical protein VFA74_06140 [Terriglobales bacterium]|nr:hypothetical protein [Terriglobales bacterium]